MPTIIGKGGQTPQGAPLPWTITPGQQLRIWFSAPYADQALAAFPIPFLHPVFATNQVMAVSHGMRVLPSSMAQVTVFTVDIECRDMTGTGYPGIFCLAISALP